MKPVSTQAVIDWLDACKTGLPVKLADDGAPEPKGSLALHLMGIEPAASLNDSTNRPMRLLLTYQIAVIGGNPVTAHGVLCELMFAAMKTPVVAGKDAQFPMSLVNASDARQRYGISGATTALFVDVIVERERDGRRGPPVREPAVLKTSSLN